MAFRTRRQKRYVYLRNAGFLPFEARALSKVPYRSVPYFRELIDSRRRLLVGKTTKLAREKAIKDLYEENKWYKAGKRFGKVLSVADPWKMLRDYEDIWRSKQPEYSSPWQKRKKRWDSFVGKYERTINRQRK